MSSQALETVRRFWESAGGDADEFAWDTVHPEVEVRDFDLPDATEVYRGHDGFARWASVWAGAWEDYQLEPAEYVDAGKRWWRCSR